MRFLTRITLGVMLLAAVAMTGAEEPLPWFDLEKCAFCKQLGAEEGLIDHMHAEYHDLKEGILSVMTVDKGHEEAFARAQQGMKQVAEEMQKTGQVPYMCEHCKTYGEFLMSGVATECVEAEVGSICLMTSGDPEMVKRLQAFGRRNTEEMAKFHASREKK